MDTDIADNVSRAARNLITQHGTASESIALARAKSADQSDRLKTLPSIENSEHV